MTTRLASIDRITAFVHQNFVIIIIIGKIDNDYDEYTNLLIKTKNKNNNVYIYILFLFLFIKHIKYYNLKSCENVKCII